jgi:hypothetical protein
LKDAGERIENVVAGFKHVIAKTTLGRVYTWGWVYLIYIEIFEYVKGRQRTIRSWKPELSTKSKVFKTRDEE